MKNKYDYGNGKAQIYLSRNYFLPGRFAAYAYQIREIIDSEAKHVLEIGPGNGIVSFVLREVGIDVITLDIDYSTNPDCIATTLNIPFSNNSFDAILCCQVLEHLPWTSFRSAMKELVRVANSSIILSMPHICKRYYIDFKLPRIKRIMWEKYIDFETVPLDKDAEHKWEIGRGASEKEVLEVFKAQNLKLLKSYRVPEFRIHHFFSLSVSKQDERI